MTDGPDPMEVVVLVIMLVLPLSALIARRLPVRRLLPMILAWTAIFVAAIALMATGVVEKLSRRFDQTSVSGTTTRLTRDGDGHFVADVRLNGTARRMLVDTGATSTLLSGATATAAGLTIGRGSPPIGIQTANGTIEVYRATVNDVVLGDIHLTGLPVLIQRDGDTDVIGMNLLRRLSGWRVEGATMTLEP